VCVDVTLIKQQASTTSVDSALPNDHGGQVPHNTSNIHHRHQRQHRQQQQQQCPSHTSARKGRRRQFPPAFMTPPPLFSQAGMHVPGPPPPLGMMPPFLPPGMPHPPQPAVSSLSTLLLHPVLSSFSRF